MSDTSGVILAGGAPPVGVMGSVPAPAPTSTGATIAADAAGPVWQPWVNMQNNALSAFKTDIDTQLGKYNGRLTAAQRYLASAEMTAATLSQSMVLAGQAIYEQYMNEANRLYNAVMGPAITAYNAAAADAHTKLWEGLTPPERTYAQASVDATWTQGLANGNAKLGEQAPVPGSQ